MKINKTKVNGVNELFGKQARDLRKLLRSFEDTLDARGFDQLIPGILSSDEIFRQNLDFLGNRFMDNLVYADVNGEKNIVILPEGTMRTYDFIKRNRLDQAKIFYNEQFVRNEPLEEVEKGKTRAFYQTGFEIFNYPLIESGVEAMTTVYELIKNAGIDDIVIRMADKRLISGLLQQYTCEDKKIIQKIMDKADDSPIKFERLYKLNGGKDPNIKHMIAFIEMGLDRNLSLTDLAKFDGSKIYHDGLHDLYQIQSNISREVKLEILPFMAKSWDACDRLLFDARSLRYNGALAGGGNLTYGAYEKSCPKSGAGLGTTRIFELLQK